MSYDDVDTAQRDYMIGLGRVLQQAVVHRWWVAPGADTVPPLSVEVAMAEVAKAALVTGASEARARKAVARRFPAWAHLVGELVDCVAAELAE